MTVTLPWANSNWALFRVLYADTFGSTGAGPWTEAPYLEPGVNGVWFDSCDRGALPTIGMATLTMEYGTIDDEEVTPLDLLDKHIRIQAARPVSGDVAVPEWRTIWLGRCEWQDDDIHSASPYRTGTRTYRCVDLLYAYTRGYPLDRHANYALTATDGSGHTVLAYGHPGYNYQRGSMPVVVGNKEITNSVAIGPDSTGIINFATPDSEAGVMVNTWADHQAITNAMLLRRVSGDPIFTLDYNPSGSADTLLSGKTPWPIGENETAWSFINRVLDRRRGKGFAYFGWEDDASTPDGAIDVRLYVRPQLAVSLSYSWSGGTITIPGADSVDGFAYRADLVDDMRVVDDEFKLRDTTDSAVDELTTEGERIQVAVTMSGSDGTTANRWSTELETEYLAATEDVQKEARFRPVLQCYGILRTAAVAYMNGDGDESQRADYWSYGSDGALSITHTTVTAPEMIEMMSDLPMYVGYDYSATPPAPLSSALPDGTPSRLKPVVLVRTSENRFITPKEYIEGGASVSVDDDGIWVEWAGDDDGWRSVRGEWPGTVTRTITEDSLTFTVGLRMPQRPTFSSNVSGDIRRRKTIRVPDCHLWVAHAGTIYDLDRSTETLDGCNAKRVGGTIGSIAGKILRDDREALARVHAVAWEWYRSDAARMSVTWALRDCALIPTWEDESGTAKLHPKLGQMLTQFIAGGVTYTPNTPITRVSYDNKTGTTKWSTDWTEYDHGAA